MLLTGSFACVCVTDPLASHHADTCRSKRQATTITPIPPQPHNIPSSHTQTRPQNPKLSTTGQAGGGQPGDGRQGRGGQVQGPQLPPVHEPQGCVRFGGFGSGVYACFVVVVGAVVCAFVLTFPRPKHKYKNTQAASTAPWTRFRERDATAGGGDACGAMWMCWGWTDAWLCRCLLGWWGVNRVGWVVVSVAWLDWETQQ